MKRQFYFSISIFAIAILGIVLNSTFNQSFTHAGFGSGTEGDPYQVCASGCDYTTISAAMQAVSANEFIEVQASYNTSTEIWPITFGDTGVTLTCSASSVVIGPTTTNANQGFQISTDSVITGCTIDASENDSNSYLISEDLGTSNSWSLIENTIINHNIYPATSSLVHNNIIVDSEISYQSSNNTVSSNTISLVNVSSTLFEFRERDDLTIASNTINFNYLGGDVGNAPMFDFNGDDANDNITIVSNTISYATSTPQVLLQLFKLGENFEFSGNKVKYQGSAETPMIMYSRTNVTSSLNMTHNTFFLTNYTGGTNQRSFMVIEDDTDSDTGPLFATATHNIFYFDGTGTTTDAIAFAFQTDVPTSQMYEDYNGFAGSMGNPAFFVGGDEDVPVTSGGNSEYTVGSSPMRDKNASALDDFLLNPMSSFLDVDGTVDIGAVPGTRGSNFGIDDDGTINYTSVHGTSTADISGNVRSGDTWTIAAGSYLPFALASTTLATSSVTITGAGANTIIAGTSAYTYGVSVTGFADVTLQDMLIQNASSTTNIYTMTVGIFDFGGATYDDTGTIGGSADSTLFVNGACNTLTGDNFISSDDTDITTFTEIGTEDIHLALVNFGGNKFTGYVPNSVAATAAEVLLLDGCDGISVDAWVTSTFALSGSTYTYDTAAIAAAGVSVSTTMATDPPAITRVQTVSAGIKLDSSPSITITNVTSTNNAYGIHFSGDTAGSSLNSSTISNSTAYDVYTDSTEDNSIKNSYFTSASTSIADIGNVDVYYRYRALATTTSAGPLAGVGVSFTRGDSGDTVTVTTTADGYTPYTDFLLAFTMSSSSIANTAGGYNPWTISAAATSTYAVSSTSAILASVNGSETLVLTAATTIPTAPTTVTSTEVTSSTITFLWTDNSNDETGFIIDYIASSSTDDFPGTTTTISSNATSTMITGLSTSTDYMFRVAAYNNAGISAYATSTVTTTLGSGAVTAPTAPTDPVLTSTTTTSIVFSWTDNAANEDGFEYDVAAGSDGTAFPSGNQVVSSTADITSVTWTGLTANTQYIARAAAYNSTATSTYATSSAFYTLANVPTSVSGAAASQTSIDVSFTGDGTSYVVQNQNDASTSTGASSAITVSGLTCGTSYTFKVKALNGDSVETAYSATSAAVSTSACSTPSSSSSSSGGSFTAPSTPKLPTGTEATNGALQIEDGASTTNSRAVTLAINATNVSQMAISNSLDFSGASFVPYASSVAHTLTAGNGTKSVYVKLRSSAGGTLTVTDSIVLSGQSAEQTVEVIAEETTCPLPRDGAYSVPGNAGVYYVTADCTKRPFKRSDIYFTYFTNWTDTLPTTQATLDSIPNDPLGFMPYGPLYNPASGALIKLPNDAKVYLLLGETIYHIANEEAAEFQFGPEWASWIDTVDPRVTDTYTVSPTVLDNLTRPDGILIKYTVEPKVYQLATPSTQQVKRWITNEATFTTLGFRWDRIVTIPSTEVYVDGGDL